MKSIEARFDFGLVFHHKIMGNEIVIHGPSGDVVWIARKQPQLTHPLDDGKIYK